LAVQATRPASDRSKWASLNRPWVGAAEKRAASILRRLAGDTPLAFDYAVKCPGNDDAAVEQCRAHLRRTLNTVKPTRVLVFGSTAARGLLGRTVPTKRLRKGWTRLADGTPVFFLPDPFAVSRNRVESGWLREDIEWALTTEPPDAPFDATYRRVETVEDALACEADLGSAAVFDTETFGKPHTPLFKIVTLAITKFGKSEPWVWPEESMTEGDPRRPILLRTLKALDRIGGHNIKWDLNAVALYLGVDLGHTASDIADTYVWAKQLRADGSGGLDDVSNHIGAGGHKAEAEKALAIAKSVISRLRSTAYKSVAIEWEYEERVNKAGKKQRRKKPTLTRPPNSEEIRATIFDQWTKERSFQKSKTSFRELTGIDQPTEDWIAAVVHNDAEPATFAYGLMDRTVCERYCARDTGNTSLLAAEYARQLKGPFADLWGAHLKDAPWAIGQIERWGMRVDAEKAAGLAKFLDQRSRELLAEIHAHVPDLNPGSPDQLGAYLFKPTAQGGLGLRAAKFSKKTGKPSSDKATLAALKGHHPIIEPILGWKEIDKLQGTYARGMIGHVRPDGRIHASFNIMGAETGRMSCTEPNMQTIPSRGKHAKLVKDLFVSEPGRLLVQLDYRTLEMRVAAMLSGDPVMIQIFLDGEDPHRSTAEGVSEMLWGNDFATCGGIVHLEDLKAEQKRRRSVCKWVNFGTVYGQAPQTLAEMAGTTVKEAEKAQDIVLGRFAVLRKWIKRTIAEAQQTGETWTWWANKRARRRPVPDIGSEDKGDVGHGQRQAFNTPVQGTGHEYCLASAIESVRWIVDDQIDAKLVMAVHDSLVFEVAEEDAPELVEVVTSIMEGWPTMHGLPLEVDVEVGRAWGSLVSWGEWTAKE
jgi:DNA polymerase I-like protein with 3'-5' exonuclease and polymerase domains